MWSKRHRNINIGSQRNENSNSNETKPTTNGSGLSKDKNKVPLTTQNPNTKNVQSKPKTGPKSKNNSPATTRKQMKSGINSNQKSAGQKEISFALGKTNAPDSNQVLGEEQKRPSIERAVSFQGAEASQEPSILSSYTSNSISSTSYADSSSFGSSTSTDRWSCGIKPPYAFDKSRNIRCVSLSEDRLASSAYNLVASKNGKGKETSGKGGRSRRRRKRRSSSLSSSRGRSSGASRRVSDTNTTLQDFPRTTQLQFFGERYKGALTKHICSFVQNRPEIYDGSTASLMYGRPNAVSFTQLNSEASKLVKEVDAPIPILKPVSSVTSDMALPEYSRAFSSKEFTKQHFKPALMELTAKEQFSQDPSKEEIVAVPSDPWVKIHSRHGGRVKVEKIFDNFTSNIVKCPKHGESCKDQNGTCAGRPAYTRNIRHLVETRHTSNSSVFSNARQLHKQDCRSAFRSQRIPTFRRSPAYILCPVPLTKSSAATTPTLKEVSTAASSARSSLLDDGTFGGVGNVKMVRKRRAQKTERVSLSPCWERGGFGSVRIDRLGIGAPRFYYWAPFNERMVQMIVCWFQTLAEKPKLTPRPLPFFENEEDLSEEISEASSLYWIN